MELLTLMLKELIEMIEILQLRLLTRVGLVRQNVLILSEVSLYVERSKNLEKKICYHRAKKIHLPKGV